MPPHLKISINQAYLENGTYEQIVRHHLEQEMELNGLEADEPLVKTQMTVDKTLKHHYKPLKQRPKLQTQSLITHSKTTNVDIARKKVT